MTATAPLPSNRDQPCPPLDAFTLGDTAVGGTNKRNRVRDLTTWRPRAGAVDAYMTPMRFTANLRMYAAGHTSASTGACPSVEGYDGWGYADAVYFDFDHATDPAVSLADARTVLHAWKARYDIDVGAVGCWYTGSKGFRLRVPASLFGGFAPDLCRPLGRRIKRLAQALTAGCAITTMDESIYDAVRLLRVPSSRHGKTGRTMIPLTAGELFELDMALIEALATGPRDVDVLPDDEWRHIPELVALWEAVADDPVQHSGSATAHYPDAPPSAQAMPDAERRARAVTVLADAWPAAGHRHAAATALAGGLQRDGISPEDSLAFLVDVVTAAMGTAATDRGETGEWERIVKGTTARLTADEPAVGWPTLERLIGERPVTRARLALGLIAILKMGEDGEEMDSSDTNAGVGSEKRKARSDASLLMLLTEESAELFHTPDGTAYATLTDGGPRETWPLTSNRLRIWLAGRFYRSTTRPAARDAISGAIEALQARALYDGPEYPVAVRIARLDGAIYLDRGASAWDVIEVTADGWRVVPVPPAGVRFRRTGNTDELPIPERGGSIEDLHRFLNLASEDDFTLFVAWLLQALRVAGTYVVLLFMGPQGSAKSTQARVARALVDPSRLPLRSEPREARDLMIAAQKNWTLVFDNISHLLPWQSDSICRLSTGGGFGTRQLHTDGDEITFDAVRPVVITGIDGYANRADLLDRAIVLTLPAISDEDRELEQRFWPEFEAARPRILGALLDGVSRALAEEGNTHLTRRPRMADAAEFAAAAMPALGPEWSVQRFLRAYDRNRSDANDSAIEASAIGAAVVAFVNTVETWEGSATALLREFAECVPEETRRAKGWPGTAKALSDALRRLETNLRQTGVDVIMGKRRGHNRERVITLRKRGARASASSASSSTDSEGRPSADARGGDADAGRPSENSASAADAQSESGADDADDADGDAEWSRSWHGSSPPPGTDKPDEPGDADEPIEAMRVDVLDRAAGAEWPQTSIQRGVTVGPGADVWRLFVAGAKRHQLQHARKALDDARSAA